MLQITASKLWTEIHIISYHHITQLRNSHTLKKKLIKDNIISISKAG